MLTKTTHPALEFEPFSLERAEVDYNVTMLRRCQIVAWDSSTMTLQAIRDGLRGNPSGGHHRLGEGRKHGQ